MAAKRILCRERLRRVPRTFSWVDHRLVRDGHIGRCSHEALALYLFLVTVSDAQGLSYYSDVAVCRLLNMDQAMLSAARREVRKAGLIAYECPLYQVLALDEPNESLAEHTGRTQRGISGEVVSIGEVLRRSAGGAL